MVTPNRRRQAVVELEDVFGVSQRRACRVVGQPRATQRLVPPKPSSEEQQIREWLRAFAKRRPRWGWRRAAKGLRREGWQVNDKKVRRLWRDEGLRVPQKRRKKRLTGIGARVGLMSLLCPNALWAMDFQFDTTVNGRTLKLLNVIDEFTREALATDTHRSIDADHVVAVLDRLCASNVADHPRSFASTTGPNLLPTRSLTGASSTMSTPCSSTPAARGRTLGSNHSTAECETSYSTCGTSIRCSKPKSSSRTGARTTT
jgi:putative transposase